jgi:hypothetical protein
VLFLGQQFLIPSHQVDIDGGSDIVSSLELVSQFLGQGVYISMGVTTESGQTL